MGSTSFTYNSIDLMLDLHTHTVASDGSVPPLELIREAAGIGIDVLGITDHDTFAGYDEAVTLAKELGIRLVCGIELSTKLNGQTVHVLGYFFDDREMTDFLAWVRKHEASRRERNLQLIARLQELGMNVSLEEVKAYGQGLTGRPHFAQALLAKGYVVSLQEAFDKYLAESGKAFVPREEPSIEEAIGKIRESRGIASLAHPVRIKGDISAILPALREAGLNAVEVYHSDHSAALTEIYLGLAKKHALKVTGGSDFHGTFKPDIKLGTGRNGNLNLKRDLLEQFGG